MHYQSIVAALANGVTLTHGDAVALVQELLASAPATACSTDVKPLTWENVRIASNGAVACDPGACVATVKDVAMLLDDLLSRGQVARMPGGLRYVVARALRLVDAPAFKSLGEFSAALERFEAAPREEVLRGLFARMDKAAPAPHDVERRHSAPSAAVLRRQLREADAALFASQAARASLPPRARASTGAGARMLAGAAALTAAFGAGYVVMDRAPALVRKRPAAMASLVPARIASRADATATRAVLTAHAIAPVEPIGQLPDAETETTNVALNDSDADDGAMATKSIGHGAISTPQRSSETPAVVRGVSAAAGPVFSPSFASDGTAMFFHAGRSSDARNALETSTLTGDDLGVLTIVDDGAKNYHVQPSPDGQRVAFDSDRDGERGIYIANRDGTNVQRVSGPGYAAVPTWSPDGTQLAFIRSEPRLPRVWNLWLLDIASGRSRRLTAFPFGETWSASWFPDGRRVAYSHEDRVIVRDIVSGASTEYASPVAGRLARTPAVSPDGHYVIFQVARSGAWLLDVRDGSMRCVLTDPTAEEFAWSPDGRRVAFHSRRDGQWGIWLMSAP